MSGLPIQRLSPTTVTIDGRKLIAFAGCNYLGLSQHPEVTQAMVEAAGAFGVSTAAARQTTGNTVLHDEMERTIASFLGLDDAVLTIDGYAANVAVAQALAPERSTAILDARAHRSLQQAATGAPMKALEYEHLNAHSAAAQLNAQPPGSAIVMTDGIFAADGALAPADQLLKIAADADAILLIDDCHSIGTLGPAGKGSAAAAGVNGSSSSHGDSLVVTGTFAKGLGCYGGFAAGPQWICELIRRRSSIYQTTTPVPPCLIAAALKALQILEREPRRLERLRSNTTLMRNGLQRAGLPLIETPAPIFSFTLRPAELMNALHDALLHAGFLAPILAYPQGPASQYFRLSVTSEHSDQQIEAFLEALTRIL